MKKGILFRLLVIVLVCAMLFGLMGFTTIEPQSETNDVQNEEVNEPIKNQAEEEPQPSQKPEGKNEEAEDPIKPGLIKVSVMQNPGGTLKLVGELPESAETKEDGTVVFSVEKGTELAFVAAAAKEGVVSSEFVAAYVNDGTTGQEPTAVEKITEGENGYEFSVTVGEKPITVSAEFFGIKSVEVSNADVWVNASNKDCGKTITVKTFGAASVAITDAEDAAVEVKSAEDNVFTAFVDAKDYQLDEKGKDFTVKISNPDNGLNAETRVKVCKIDTVAPEVSFVSKQEKKEGRKTWSYVTWKITETGSGVVNKFNFERKLLNGRVSADTANDTYKYDPNTGLLTFKVLAINYNNLVVTFHDVAGNETEAKSPVKSYVEIVGVSKGHFDESDKSVEAWWAGLDAELLFNSDKEDAMVFVGDKSVAVNKESIETDEDGVRQYSANISESGKYTVKSEDENASDTAVIKYDPTAPVISNAKFDKAYVGDNWLKNFLSDITNGWLFNNGFRFTFDVEEIDSGVYAYAYKLVNEGEEEPTAPDIRAAKAGETNGWIFTFGSDAREVVVENTGEFTGYVYLCVWDNAENYNMVRVGVDENNKEAIITNVATKNDDDTPRDSEEFDPYLTVMAKAGDQAYDGNEWTKVVDFKIGFKLPENESATATVPVTTTADGSQVTSDQEIEVKYEYQFVSLTESHSNSADGTDSGTITENPADEGRYLDYSIGADAADHQSFNGEVTFTLVCEKIASTSVEGADVSGLNKEVTFSTCVPVKIQNFIASPVVSVNGTGVANDYVSAWFNGKTNTLDSVVITKPASAAPFSTTYSLSYQAVNSDTSVGVVTNEEITEAKLSIDNDNIEKYFTKAGVYTLTTSTKDDCENTPDSEPTITIYYDPYPATISVEFSQEKTYSATDNEYFDILRNAKVLIKDDAFNGTESTDSFVSITKTFGADPNYGSWKFEANTKDGGGTWSNETISYGVASGAVKDGDHYKMTVSVTDNAGNTSRTDDQGNYYIFGKGKPESSEAYRGHAANDFTIDQTKPVVTVSFDNNNVRNGMYFNAGRTATITVVEHNFDAGRVVMTATNATAGADPHTGWVQSKDNKDIWTKTVTFNPQDATCEFNIEVTDLAGNVCRNTGVNYGNSAAHDKFVIDRVNPTLGVTGTDQTPYPDTCMPGFTGNDTNISSANGSAEYTVQLTRTVREHKNQDVTNLFANINPNMGADIISVVYANIPDDAENDGIYTLNVSVTDLAGNSSQTSNTFTVNRHGSFYVFNDALSDLVNAKYVQKADGKYSITEYNASPLVAGSVKIEIYRDGQLEKTIKPTVGAAVLGASGLYEYTYDLPAENFAQDGRYSVSVSSEDEAKNMSDNTKLEESILEFTVDSVNPEIVIIKGLEKAIVNAEELEFTVNAVDTYGIKSIQIIVDGEVVKTFVPQEVYDQLKAEGKAMQQYEVMDENLDFTAAYTLYESSAKQSIEILVTDMAGNSFTTASKDFAPVYDFHDSILVSTSFFARYIHNPVALVGTGIVIAGAVWLVLAKKKKTEEAAA